MHACFQKKTRLFLVYSLTGQHYDYATNTKSVIILGMSDEEIAELVIEESIKGTAGPNHAWRWSQGMPGCLKSHRYRGDRQPKTAEPEE